MARTISGGISPVGRVTEELFDRAVGSAVQRGLQGMALRLRQLVGVRHDRPAQLLQRRKRELGLELLPPSLSARGRPLSTARSERLQQPRPRGRTLVSMTTEFSRAAVRADHDRHEAVQPTDRLSSGMLDRGEGKREQRCASRAMRRGVVGTVRRGVPWPLPTVEGALRSRRQGNRRHVRRRLLLRRRALAALSAWIAGNRAISSPICPPPPASTSHGTPANEAFRSDEESACGPGGRGFESPRSPLMKALQMRGFCRSGAPGVWRVLLPAKGTSAFIRCDC